MRPRHAHGWSPTEIIAPATSRARGRETALWTLHVLLAAVYCFSACGKLTADAQNVAGFEAMGLGPPARTSTEPWRWPARSRCSSRA